MRTHPTPRNANARPPAEAERAVQVEPARERSADEEDAWYEARRRAISVAVSTSIDALGEGNLVAAAAPLVSYLETHGGVEDEPPSRITALLEHVRWLEALPRTIEVSGARWLDVPQRRYVVLGAVVLAEPEGEARGPFGSLDLDAVDVWAEVPDGPVLIARPNEAPSFEVRSHLLAVAGWVSRDQLSEQPPREQTLDTGRPLAIRRAPRIVSASANVGGQYCQSAGGTRGLGFVLNAGTEHHCEPLLPLCGGGGLIEASFEFDDDMVCADCISNFRSFIREGDFCRSEVPGSTWRCAPGGEHLVCTAPGAPPDSVEPEPPLPPLAPAESGEAEVDALVARLRREPSHFTNRMLQFHARAHRDALLELLCAADEPPSRRALVIALRETDAFAAVEDRYVPCLRRLSGTELQPTLAELPDPRLRGILETIVAQPLDPRDGELARATLEVIDAAARGAWPALLGRHMSNNRRFFDVQRVAAEGLADPRPIVPTLIAALTHPDASDYVRRTARRRLRLMGVPHADAEEARAFYAAHRDEPLDAWMAAAVAREDDVGRWSLYRVWWERQPGPAGIAALVAGLEDANTQNRDDAAVALARWGDRRAIPVLAAHLPSHAAFLALGWLHDSSMGFGNRDLDADARRLVQLVQRWRAWAEHEAQSSN
ncbi:MAG: hypothetical protein AB8I08_27750 [Sandaracinaceae bacterium]